MVDRACSLRRLSQLFLLGGFSLLAAGALAVAQPVTVSPRWTVEYSGDDPVSRLTTACPSSGGVMLVSVMPAGASGLPVSLSHGSQPIDLKSSVVDPVSRLVFLSPTLLSEVRPREWVPEVRNTIGEVFTCTGADGPLQGTNQGWVRQIGGKVLPFALLRISFENGVPPLGSPLIDRSGRVAGIIFQAGDYGKSAYVIPAEAVLRVQKDMESSGKLVRGWLGLTLRPENQAPRIVTVFKGSPADKVGIQPDDILVNVGGRSVTDYPDAANAFFYLRPGEPVRMKFKRGSELWEITATPTVAAKD